MIVYRARKRRPRGERAPLVPFSARPTLPCGKGWTARSLTRGVRRRHRTDWGWWSFCFVCGFVFLLVRVSGVCGRVKEYVGWGVGRSAFFEGVK